MATLFTPLFLLGVAGVVLLVIAIIWHWHRPKFSTLNLKLLAIRLPKQEAKDGAGNNFLQEINVSEQVIGALAAVKEPFAFEVAVHNVGSDINFYLAVSRSSLDFATRQIQGLFPNAQVVDVPEYNIFNPDGGCAGAYLCLTTDYALPLRTYKEGEVDTFAPVINTLSKLEEAGDGAAIQYMFVPADSDPRGRILNFINGLKKGKKLKELFSAGILNDLKDLAKTKDPNKPEEPKIVDEESVKALTAKVSKPLFYVQVRLVTGGGTTDRAEDLMLSLGGSFAQFTAPVRNGFKVVKVKDLAKFNYQFSFREFSQSRSMVLNSEEITSIFHLPVSSTDVPRISWLKSREATPPANLPSEGVILGNSVFRGDEKPVRFADDDRRRHLYIVGQTGTGKSMGMLNMAIQDMSAGKGFCVIDPHGDLTDKVLAMVPPERIDDVIVFDPGDLSRPLGLNMLEYNFDRPEEKTFIVNEMISIFNRLYDMKTAGGPQFEQYMKNALLLLMEDANPAKGGEPATLMEVARVFTDPEWRKKKLARITNPTVVDFWEKEAIKTSGDQGLANMTPYVTSKFNSFTANDYMRPIIGQPKSAFNFREVMDSGKILLVNLSKGKIGDLNASLVGMIIVGRILMAALSRADMPDDKRKDFYLYIDEFQNFTTDSIAVILSEARKYRLCLTLAHQFIAQLEDDIREAVFGNVGSMLSFRVGVPDTEFLVKQFGPEFTERDLTSIENGSAFAKLLIHGEPSRPFNLKTLRVPSGSVEIREKLKELSRLTYGRDLAEIEAEILARLRQ